MSAPATVDVFQTFNKKTKTGLPTRWRWRITDKDGDVISKSPHSFRTEAKCVTNLEANGVPDGIRARRLDVHGNDLR